MTPNAEERPVPGTSRRGVRVRAAAPLAVWMLVLGGFGGPLAGTSLSATSHGHRGHRGGRYHHRAPHRIPQHNRGDADPDNNGRPSDGDGDI
jgi:hypothetical protein